MVLTGWFRGFGIPSGRGAQGEQLLDGMVHRHAHSVRTGNRGRVYNERLSNRPEVNAASHTRIVVAAKLQNTQQLSGRTVLPQSPFPFFPR